MPRMKRKRNRPQYSSSIRITFLFIVMGFGLTRGFNNKNKAEAIAITASSPAMLEARLRGALWGYFSGDALAMPTHWYYFGFPQIQGDYGTAGITGYTKPVTNLPGSIMNKSNINGGGRGSFGKTKEGVSIIGDVINHGKRDYWDPSKQGVHYHATLSKGENTLEVQLARVLMKSIVANKGAFNANHFRDAYMEFMTKAGSHNDAYASTCHRMFFANLVIKKLSPENCPDNDSHNVDTIDGLVLPTITALAYANSGDVSEISDAAAATAAVTRKSAQLEGYSRVWGLLVASAVNQDSQDAFVQQDVPQCAKSLGLPKPTSGRGLTMTACYLKEAFPSTLDMISSAPKAWDGLIANANVGGENVHRGSILGAVLGARQGNDALPEKLKTGLHDSTALEQEIDAFVKAVLNR